MTQSNTPENLTLLINAVQLYRDLAALQIRLPVSRKCRRLINLSGFTYQKSADVRVTATAATNLNYDDDDEDDDDNDSKLRQYLSNKAGEREIKELQKTAILGTADKLRKVLM